MKAHAQNLLAAAFAELQRRGELPADLVPTIAVERARDRGHGDFASNVALTLARAAGRKPRDLAEALVAVLPASDQVARVEVAGPGFINFWMAAAAFQRIPPAILEAGEEYGRGAQGAGARMLVEFVSANPTGPLHVGHGRGAAFGAAVANLLEASGYTVHREYYVNDAGRQMDILAVSVWLRYLELCGEGVPFPSNGYRGDYVYDIAAALHREAGEALRRPAEEVGAELPPDAPGGDKEAHIDGLIARARRLLGEEAYRRVHDLALAVMLEEIRGDLAAFGVEYNEWFSERSLSERGAVQHAIDALRRRGHTYERDGALWFRSSAWGDEKDRVLVRENGQPTYFAADIAYHIDKRERGYRGLIDVWGADHHGYVARVKAAMAALDAAPEDLEVLLVQFAILYRGGRRLSMSTRSGEFVTLRELRNEVGRDAARFFYVMRSNEQHLDFDLDLAKSQSADNPVYYIQYAHARVCSVMQQLEAKGLAWDQARGRAAMHRLTEAHEKALMSSLSRYPEVVEAAAAGRAPHQLVHYLRQLANDFHTYYNAHPFLVAEDATLRDARLTLVLATRQVIRNGLALLDVSAPESM